MPVSRNIQHHGDDGDDDSSHGGKNFYSTINYQLGMVKKIIIKFFDFAISNYRPGAATVCLGVLLAIPIASIVIGKMLILNHTLPIALLANAVHCLFHFIIIPASFFRYFIQRWVSCSKVYSYLFNRHGCHCHTESIMWYPWTMYMFRRKSSTFPMFSSHYWLFYLGMVHYRKRLDLQSLSTQLHRSNVRTLLQ